MRCPECGQDLKRVRQDYRYKESGLDNIILVAVPVYVCPRHGVQGVALGEVALLHEDIAQAILKQERPLRGAEIRFLRKYRGWSQKELADRLGVHEVTVSKWETEAIPIGTANQVVLRFLFTAPEAVPPRRKIIGRPPVRVPTLRIPAPKSPKRATA